MEYNSIKSSGVSLVGGEHGRLINSIKSLVVIVEESGRKERKEAVIRLLLGTTFSLGVKNERAGAGRDSRIRLVQPNS